MLFDRLSQKLDIKVLFAVPATEISFINDHTKDLIVTAQSIDGDVPLNAMGKISIDNIYDAGAQALFINHSVLPVSISSLFKIVTRAKEKQILSIVCVNNFTEAAMIQPLEPDIVLYEPKEKIGSFEKLSKEKVSEINFNLNEIFTNTLIMQAAGVSTPEDVYEMFSLGVQGTGSSSGIVMAKDPFKMIEYMMKATYQAKLDFNF
ncbi:triosephosphate isomerase (TIM) [Enterococcus sp. DIV2402]|uniref:Triosephosphate isomerase (TIM) n=1 Tax=Candidatus Enterococcus lowellii TaxID=2230877 RepID=A0ABZ2SN62_9ENTE